MTDVSSASQPEFAVEVYQNPYLPDGGTEVHAIVTVSASGGTGSPTVGRSATPGAPPAAVIIMADCSGSMDYPPTKMQGARDATAAAIDALDDGVAFAVIAGNHKAVEIYPGNGELAIASPATQAAARTSLQKLTANGGTAIGTWLTLADQLFATTNAPLRHGILLTDGRNEHEEPEKLREALEQCAGNFTCDARGVGTDWEVEEVRSIARHLLGSADIVSTPQALAADFTAMLKAALNKEIPDVALRLWSPLDAEVDFVKQVAPDVADLSERRTDAGPRAGDYPTGSWGEEARDYHICVKVPAAAVGQEMLAGRVSLVATSSDGTENVLSRGLIRAVWTDDTTATTRIDQQVAHYTGQEELAEAIQEGLELRKSGDESGATARLGRAVQLAHESGNTDTAELLNTVVDVDDPVTGTVRLKKKVSDTDEMTLDTRSTKTVRVKK